LAQIARGKTELMASTGGLWMLVAVALLLVLTGLPAWIVLIGVSVIAAVAGVGTGVFGIDLLTALPMRLVGLLESDLLQALPLYALMGVLLNRLSLAEIWLRAGRRLFRRTSSASELSALGLGVLLAPLNGSVGASVAMLGRTVLPQLEDKLGSERGAALACVASTMGIVVPPSLVLVLLGDAMMRAHTEAANATGALVRIINTQDVFHAALPAACMFLLLALSVTAWIGHHNPRPEAAFKSPSRAEWAIAAGTSGFVVVLLFLVASGRLYAVEAAAFGGVALFGFALTVGGLRWPVLNEVLRDTLALTGALFALLLGATTFTLLVRSFGTDRWVAEVFAELGVGQTLPLLVALGTLVASALVLDAFEIIFVVIPIIMPPLLMRVPDATWVAVLTLLVLQMSFLLPPLGYALLMVRGYARRGLSNRLLAKALLPYLIVQVCVLALVFVFPSLVSPGPESRAAATESTGESDDLATQIKRQREGQ
jgi:TRAP-type mannitol/chloroaromatic compound transport system permease large subunit